MSFVEPPVRKSLFLGVPPFINYVPSGGFGGEIVRGPQYWDFSSWDQDQLWRFVNAMGRWIDEFAQSEDKSNVSDWEVSNTTSKRKQVSVSMKCANYIFGTQQNSDKFLSIQGDPNLLNVA